MSEREWLDAASIYELLKWSEPFDERRLRLFAVACYRRIWQWIPDQDSREFVDQCELLALAEIEEAEVGVAFSTAPDSGVRTRRALAVAPAIRSALDPKHSRHSWRDVAYGSSEYCAHVVVRHTALLEGGVYANERRAQADLVREIFGNPFRPVVLESGWLTTMDGTVPRIAEHIDRTRRFEELPILADALEEAGCNNLDLLTHLRGPGPHVRGCWALELLLARNASSS
ncbi:MAG: hypothetical protein AB7K24_05215 [Gemmataceae bacterium]